MKAARRRWWFGVYPAMFMVAVCIASGALVGAMPARRPVSCEFVCKGGRCSYSGCANGPSCPGGACAFDKCQRPSCSGGNCDFTSCRDPQCRGGNCRFVDPMSTLRDGYCDGGACEVNGKPFPSRFAGKLSV